MIAEFIERYDYDNYWQRPISFPPERQQQADYNYTHGIVRIHYENEPPSLSKFETRMQMEKLCKFLCERVKVDAEQYSLESGEQETRTVIEHDKELGSYVNDDKTINLFLVKKPKIYTQIITKENGADVIISHYINEQ